MTRRHVTALVVALVSIGIVSAYALVHSRRLQSDDLAPAINAVPDVPPRVRSGKADDSPEVEPPSARERSKSESRILNGHVRSAATGAPIHAALRSGHVIALSRRVDGSFVLPLGVTTVTKISVSAPGYQAKEVAAPPNRDNLLIELQPYTPATIRVVDDTGLAVASAKVFAFGPGGAGIVGRTNHLGWFRGRVEVGTVVYAAHGNRASKLARVVGPKPSNPPLVLALASDNCHGLGVKDSASTRAIPKALIELQARGVFVGCTIECTTGDDGLVTAPIPPGEYDASCYALGAIRPGPLLASLAPGVTRWINAKRARPYRVRVVAHELHPGVGRYQAWIEAKEVVGGSTFWFVLHRKPVVAIGADLLDVTPVASPALASGLGGPHRLCVELESGAVLRVPGGLAQVTPDAPLLVEADSSRARWLRLERSTGTIFTKLEVRTPGSGNGGLLFEGSPDREGWVGPLFWPGGDLDVIDASRRGPPIVRVDQARLAANRRLTLMVSGAGSIEVEGSNHGIDSRLLTRIRCVEAAGEATYHEARVDAAARLVFYGLRPGRYLVGSRRQAMVRVTVAIGKTTRVPWSPGWTDETEQLGRVSVIGAPQPQNLVAVPVYAGMRGQVLSNRSEWYPIGADGSFIVGDKYPRSYQELEGIVIALADRGRGLMPLAAFPASSQDMQVRVAPLVVSFSEEQGRPVTVQIANTCGGVSGSVEFSATGEDGEVIGTVPDTVTEAVVRTKKQRHKVTVVNGVGCLLIKTDGF